jgi:hypothetical protein
LYYCGGVGRLSIGYSRPRSGEDEPNKGMKYDG